MCFEFWFISVLTLFMSIWHFFCQCSLDCWVVQHWSRFWLVVRFIIPIPSFISVIASTIHDNIQCNCLAECVNQPIVDQLPVLLSPASILFRLYLWRAFQYLCLCIYWTQGIFNATKLAKDVLTPTAYWAEFVKVCFWSVLFIPTGLNLPTEAELQFYIFFSFFNPSGISRDFIVPVVSCICHVLS